MVVAQTIVLTLYLVKPVNVYSYRIRTNDDNLDEHPQRVVAQTIVLTLYLVKLVAVYSYRINDNGRHTNYCTYIVLS